MPRTAKAKPVTKSHSRTTSVTFTGEDLSDLARLIGAGKVMLQVSYPVVARLKAAMTRMGVSTKGV